MKNVLLGHFWFGVDATELEPKRIIFTSKKAVKNGELNIFGHRHSLGKIKIPHIVKIIVSNFYLNSPEHGSYQGFLY
jgi:hypothetical protein